MVSAETLNDQGWKHLAYSTEGDFILAAGDSYLGNFILADFLAENYNKYFSGNVFGKGPSRGQSILRNIQYESRWNRRILG